MLLLAWFSSLFLYMRQLLSPPHHRCRPCWAAVPTSRWSTWHVTSNNHITDVLHAQFTYTANFLTLKFISTTTGWRNVNFATHTFAHWGRTFVSYCLRAVWLQRCWGRRMCHKRSLYSTDLFNFLIPDWTRTLLNSHPSYKSSNIYQWWNDSDSIIMNRYIIICPIL